MSTDISGFGLRVRLVATNTFPAGIDLTQFADDADPFDLPEITVAEAAVGLNGDLLTWSVSKPVMATLNLIPNSEDDQNMGVLLEANRPARGRISVRDEITITGIYPDGTVRSLSLGRIMQGRPGQSIASSGRMKSKPYQFAFETLGGSR